MTILMDFELNAIFEETPGFLVVERETEYTLLTIVSSNLKHIVYWQKVLEENEEIPILGQIDETSFKFEIKDEIYRRTIKILLK
jgi:hypothetical protein